MNLLLPLWACYSKISVLPTPPPNFMVSHTTGHYHFTYRQHWIHFKSTVNNCDISHGYSAEHMQSKSVMLGTAQTNFFKLLPLIQRNRKVAHMYKKRNFVTGELQSENKLIVDYAHKCGGKLTHTIKSHQKYIYRLHCKEYRLVEPPHNLLCNSSFPQNTIWIPLL